MTITRTLSGKDLVLSLAGRLDTTTCAQLSTEVESIFTEGAVNLVFDLKDLEYISSAGLRVLVIAAKRAAAEGSTVELTGAQGTVKEVLDMTGFSTAIRR